MEQFIPLLIGLAYFIFKTYNNFREEQEKARKRNSSRPAAGAPSTSSPAPDVRPWGGTVFQEGQTRPGEPFLLEEVPDPDYPFEPRYKKVYTDTTRAELKEKIAGELKEGRLFAREGYNPETAAEEVQKGRKIHSKHLHKPVELTTEDNHASIDFDIKDAIVKQAILNRPEY